PRAMLRTLAFQPPQLLHLEGGEAEDRVALALWWAAQLNCEDPEGMEPKASSMGPCLSCSSCLRLGANMHPDLILLDGRKGSIKIDEVRGLRAILGEKPHFARRRVIVAAEAQSLGIEAANSLLKVLEDPCPDTCFVFTAPQRERLLPTLVSRGWVITLPWPEAGRPLAEDLLPWEQALGRFVSEGRGWLDLTSVRSGIDTAKAQQIVLIGQKALADCLAGREGGLLTAVFRRMPEHTLMQVDELFVESQDQLQAQVNPLLVLDTMATRLHTLAHRR
ncbi:MAG: DNA polymerase III subunit delta, partial [Mailhella sp.]|nr:DNA polymerase III subunit delta [Mailhella sp.]